MAFDIKITKRALLQGMAAWAGALALKSSGPVPVVPAQTVVPATALFDTQKRDLATAENFKKLGPLPAVKTSDSAEARNYTEEVRRIFEDHMRPYLEYARTYYSRVHVLAVSDDDERDKRIEKAVLEILKGVDIFMEYEIQELRKVDLFKSKVDKSPEWGRLMPGKDFIAALKSHFGKADACTDDYKHYVQEYEQAALQRLNAFHGVGAQIAAKAGFDYNELLYLTSESDLLI